MENGPDQILPASSLKSWQADGPVEIQMNSTEAGSKKPISVYTMLRQVAEQHPLHRAMAVEQGGKWKYFNYAEYFQECCTVARAFIALGLDRFYGVCIMGFNCPEWLIANLGGIFAGGISTGIYTTNSPDACKHLAFDSRSQILVLENQTYVDKFMKVRDQLPEVKVIIQWSGEPQEGVMSWADLIKLGKQQTDEAFELRLKQQAVNQCCTLIYTSGTTGPPKGVMCSQDNLTWVGREHGARVDLKMCGERVISYLPLSHMAAQMTDIYVTIPIAATIYFARPDVLKGSLINTLKEALPTGFFGVPRVWEKMQEGLVKAGASSGGVKKAVAGWARDKALRYHRHTIDQTSPGYFLSSQYWLATRLVLDKVKQQLGMNYISFLVSAGAPINVDVLDFFMSLDLPIMEGYGLSESLSVGTLAQAKPGEVRPGTVGKTIPLTELSLQKNDLTNPDIPGEGEICLRGRNIFMGYLNMPEKTHETITDEGWLVTGDLGWLDSDGFLRISGRAKELIITAGGENIPPFLIEEAVKEQLPIVSNAMLCGDARKYLAILLTIKSEMDPETGAPLDKLVKSVVKWCKEKGVTVTTVTELRNHIDDMQSPIAKAIDEAIATYNKEKAISNAQKVQRWRVLEHDFSLATGELNNTLKLKRSVAAKMYKSDIDVMYSED